jgi:hypothetical protein
VNKLLVVNSICKGGVKELNTDCNVVFGLWCGVSKRASLSKHVSSGGKKKVIPVESDSKRATSLTDQSNADALVAGRMQNQMFHFMDNWQHKI